MLPGLYGDHGGMMTTREAIEQIRNEALKYAKVATEELLAAETTTIEEEEEEEKRCHRF